MNRRKEADREYWRNVLNTGGLTAIPRWTLDATPGVAEHEATVAEDLALSLRRLQAETGVALTSIVLAAHAKVLAALSGETGVVTGYVATATGPALPCRLTTETDTWLALLLETDRVVSELMEHRMYPVADLERELGLAERPFETVFDPTGSGGDLDPNAVLAVGLRQRDGHLDLRLRFRTEVLDADSAARIAGYHIAALAAMAADPSVGHAHQGVLSADEVRFLIDGLSGPQRKVPDMRFHELFEQRVNTEPHAIAAVCGHRRWTYEELNARANQLGRALLARGSSRESVVAVVTERNLDWMAAVLAVFKAGAVYLPIEPHFPADRIAAMLSRSDCKLVLTESDSTATLGQALDSLPVVETLLIDAAYQENHSTDDLGIEVEPHQLAYIYFTSGSTGEPKGAMCEHAGMLNHLYAKIDDLEMGEGQVVAQVAPQCFDISLWQLVAALLVGGRTLLVSQEIILDVERFVDTIVGGSVSVLQVVPSYLEVVLSYLDQHPRQLPDLRCVSVTGEALTKELTERWFAAMPGVKLVNAYGLTETSDDTNHEVMDRPPEGDRVPLGPAINNVYVYVVDEHLSLVPLGAPGEIVFSGVCVGRGYINDPDRTSVAYMADPIRPGHRLYRSGDYGRWRPDGKLEFLGRRDAQVKIRGFRIEIGDIENALLRVPGVRNGAVVVAERADSNKHLVAFYSGDRACDVDQLQHRLRESLPAYMVPSEFHWQEALPLTDNSKINRKVLSVLAAELEIAQTDSSPPSTPAERRLAAAWAEVLGIPEEQIGRHDDFFDRGGTSLSAVRLAVALDRTVSLKDVTRYPVLAELSALIDGRTQRDARLLQLLAHPEDPHAEVLVCFPYAGGNAVNFQPMASELRRSGLGVHAVELPGHDLAAESERFAALPQVVDRVVDEIVELGAEGILLWGQSSGAAFAMETARRLREHDVPVLRVFIGAQLLGEAAARRTAIADIDGRSDAEIAAELSADSGYTTGELDPQRAEPIGAAFRHDFVSANRYLVDALDNPPAQRLQVPVTVVVAGDDPITAAVQGQSGGWDLLAESVDVYELADGGHYFPRTRPAATAQVVLRHLDRVASPMAATP